MTPPSTASPPRDTVTQRAMMAAGTPGVACVLNGMRTVEYVRDGTGIMDWESLDDVQSVYAAFNV